MRCVLCDECVSCLKHCGWHAISLYTNERDSTKAVSFMEAAVAQQGVADSRLEGRPGSVVQASMATRPQVVQDDAC